MVLEVNGNGVGGVWPNVEQNASQAPEDVADVPVPEDDEEDLEQGVLEVGDSDVDLDNTVKLLLVDSGSYVHVCPPTFMPNVQIRPSDRKIATTAGGQRLEHYGKKEVTCATWGGFSLKIEFEVMSVKRPILSVGQMSRHGHVVTLGQHSHIRLGMRVFPLISRNQLFYLPVQMEGQQWSAQVMQMLSVEKAAIYPAVEVLDMEEAPS